MRCRNILLIHPQNDMGMERLSRSDIYPPLGLLSIATYLKNMVKDLNIQVVDLNVDAFKDIDILVKDAEIVGITTTSFNYQNAIKIATKAKEEGVLVVLGGVHARALKYNILEKQKAIDYVIDGEGELPLLKLIQGESMENIPNLVYRDNGSVLENKKIFNDLSVMPIIDRNFININRYIDNYKSFNIHNFDYLRPTSVYTHKGCRWRDISGGCVFCARKDTKFQMRHIEQIWHEIRNLYEQHKIDCIWNIADDFLADLEWVKKFSKSKPKNFDIKFLIYSRSDNINKDAIALLDLLNIHEILVGFESGDSRMLINARKGCRLEDNYRAIKLLGKTKIKVYPTFVLGLPGESRDSIKKTIDFMHYVMGNCDVSRLVVSILIPFPGSYTYQNLISHEKLQGKYLLKDDFNVDVAVEDWLNNFTNTSLENIYSHIDAFSNHYKKNHTCDSKYSFEFIPN